MNPTSYLLLRLAIGASFLGHALVRLPKLRSFSSWMVEAFSKSMIPKTLVVLFSYLLPLAEFVIGVLCIAGLGTKLAVIGGSIEMIILIFGSCLIENWEPISSQLLHGVIFIVLLQFITNNTWALDNLI